MSINIDELLEQLKKLGNDLNVDHNGGIEDDERILYSFSFDKGIFKKPFTIMIDIIKDDAFLVRTTFSGLKKSQKMLELVNDFNERSFFIFACVSEPFNDLSDLYFSYGSFDSVSNKYVIDTLKSFMRALTSEPYETLVNEMLKRSK